MQHIGVVEVNEDVSVGVRGVEVNQVERVAVLERELKDVEARAADLTAKDLPALNEKLRAKKLAPIAEAAARDEGARIAAARTIEEAWAGARECVAARSREHD